MTAVELHKLNGDTSWLLRLPRQSSSSTSVDGSYYSLVLDPWLHPTPQIDGSPIFSRQTRIEPAAFASIAHLDRWLHTQSQGKDAIDAILFSHPFSDHVHPQTITDPDSIDVLRRATLFATADSLSALRSLKLDAANVVNLSSHTFRQDADQPGVLPEGIEIQHLRARDWAVSPAWNKLHGGILVSCRNGQPVDILYSPHGITPVSLPPELTSQPTNSKRVLIHSFDRQSLPLIGVVACGFPNILDLIPAFRPELVLATHDENKRGEGIVGRLLAREVFDLKHARQLVVEKCPEQAHRCSLKQLAPGETVRIP